MVHTIILAWLYNVFYIYTNWIDKASTCTLNTTTNKTQRHAWLIYVVERNVSTHIYYSFDLSFRLVVYSVLLFSHEIQSWSDYFFLSLWHHLRENESRRIKCFIQSISRKHIYIELSVGKPAWQERSKVNSQSRDFRFIFYEKLPATLQLRILDKLK